MEYQILMITQKLYLTLFVLAVLQGYVEHQNFEEWINWIQVIKPWKFILWDHVKAIFVLSGSNGWHRFTVITSKSETILNPFIVPYIGIII